MYKISKDFKEKYILARQFRKQYGHLRIPYDYIIEIDNKKIFLGMWIHNLRQAKLETANRIKISKAEEQLLNKIGMEWDIYLSGFMKNFNKILDNSEGAKIRNILEDDSLKLWMHNIVGQYQRNKLVGIRKEIYENNINMFSIRYLKWQYNYYLAQKFYNQYNHLNIPRDYILDGYDIGWWIDYQRRAYENNVLTSNEIQMLEEIGMIWCLREYGFINNEINKYNKKKVYQKLRDRLQLFINTYDDIIFDEKEQIVKINNGFQKYLDYTKK